MLHRNIFMFFFSVFDKTTNGKQVDAIKNNASTYIEKECLRNENMQETQKTKKSDKFCEHWTNMKKYACQI